MPHELLIELLLAAAVVVFALGFLRMLRQLKRIELNIMKIRIEDTTLDALLTIAEQAVAADAVDKSALQALQATVANEEDMPAPQQARIDALIPPTPPTS